VCGTKNFASVRLYSAPQLHRTIVAILGICAYGTPKQVETRRHNQTDPLPALGAKPHESSASGGYLGNAFKGSKASMRRSIGTTDTRRSEPRAPRREPAGFAMPFRCHPTLKFSAEVFPLLGTSS
jgi:hypothetical protein